MIFNINSTRGYTGSLLVVPTGVFCVRQKTGILAPDDDHDSEEEDNTERYHVRI